VRLHVLGSGTFLADPSRGAPGFLIRAPGAALLVDAGSGTLQRMARAGLCPSALDALLLTHRHVDHCADLGPLLFCMKHQRNPMRNLDLQLIGSEGLGEHLDRLYALWGPSLRADHFEIRLDELPVDGPGTAGLPGGFLVATLPANHPEGALHVRLTAPDGASVAFSGDTGPSESLEQLAAGVDLLVCECALARGERSPLHLAAEDVAQLAAAARPRRILLAHRARLVEPEADLAVVAAAGVPVSWAHDGEEHEILRAPAPPLVEGQ
jgi:ribonuclease BN (tRNA processing enzyme)